jgi:hypothetical protein
MKFLHLIAIWAIYSTSCIAIERESEVIGVAFPESTIVSSSIGLIEGKSYLAAVLRMNSENSIALVLFQLGEHGDSKLVAKSAWWLEHQRWYSESTTIKNNAVYFSLSGNGGCCTDYNLQYQFKELNGKFTLVGSEQSDIGIEPQHGKDGGDIEGKYTSYKSGSSTNYLSNTVIRYRIERPSTVGYKNDFLTTKSKKKVVFEKKSGFSRSEKILLENFDIWKEMESGPQVP